MSLTDVNVGQDWDEAEVTAGAEINASGRLALIDQRTVNEDFSGAALPAAVGSVVSGAGSIVLNGPAAPYILQKKINGSSIAVTYLINTFDESNPFRGEVALLADNFGSVGFMWMLSGYSAPPTSGDIGTDQIFILRRSVISFSIEYKDAGGTPQRWNGTAWQSALATLPLVDGIWKFICLISDGTSWKIRVGNADGTLFTETTPIAWAATRALGGGEDAYLVIHDIRPTTPFLTVGLSSVIVWPTELATTYLTSAQSCPGQIILTSEPFNSDNVRFKTDRVIAASAEVRLYVDVDDEGEGPPINVNIIPVAGLTGVYKFEAGTDFTPASKVVLRPEVNSPSGSTQIEISLPWIDDVTCISDPPAESDVRLGTVYEGGGLTGTAAIPGPNDVRFGVPTDATVGNYVPADEDKHQLGDSYGSLGTEFTGTKALTAFQLPVEVILEDEEIIIIEGVE